MKVYCVFDPTGKFQAAFPTYYEALVKVWILQSSMDINPFDIKEMELKDIDNTPNNS